MADTRTTDKWNVAHNMSRLGPFSRNEIADVNVSVADEDDEFKMEIEDVRSTQVECSV